MTPLSEQERRDSWKSARTVTTAAPLLTSQLPVEKWHVQIGDPTVADSILDRLVHNAYRIELSGESIRKKKGRGPRRIGLEVVHQHRQTDSQAAHRMFCRCVGGGESADVAVG